MSSKTRRAELLARNTKIIHALANKYDLNVKHLNNGFQLRIEGVMDIYPVGQRWHWLPDNSRGDWADGKHLRKIMLRKLEIGEHMQQPINGIEITGVNRVKVHEIKIPEIPFPYEKFGIAYAPPEMFYRKPKWYQWRLKRKYRKLLETT